MFLEPGFSWKMTLVNIYALFLYEKDLADSKGGKAKKALQPVFPL